ncbi:MAG TPA: MarR family transcriptional regulator [Ilumatobacter sp.]|nr:MarR family transcriptional regulator [Ilumatobacter sp.]
MPRLDAARMRAWRDLQATIDATRRAIDYDLRSEWAVPMAWFEVLAHLRDLGGTARPNDVAEVMGLPASSLSRRFDRLEEEGWVVRNHHVDPHDLRAVTVSLTPRGRQLWREMNVTYRRSVQAHFANRLTDEDITTISTAMSRF